MTIAEIPQRVLIVSGPFDSSLDASRAVAAIGRGLQAGGRPEPDACPLDALDCQTAAGADGRWTAGTGGRANNVRQLLDALDFDARMRAARAVIVGAERLDERTLAGTVTFEIATRARQGGVPAYAVAGEDALSSFDARMLDLQLIVEASGTRALVAAGRRLARVI